MQRELVGVGLLALLVVGGITIGGAAADDEPLADAGLDQSVEFGATVHLDAGGSVAPDSTITSYEWTIETPDGTEMEPACPSCESTSFVPTQSGVYDVTVRITTADGVSASDTMHVTVAEPEGPTASLSGPATLDTDETGTFSLTVDEASHDLGGVTWLVDSTIENQRDLSGTAAEFDRSFPSEGSFTIEAVVVDVMGRQATASHSVTVTEPPDDSPPVPDEPSDSDGGSGDVPDGNPGDDNQQEDENSGDEESGNGDTGENTEEDGGDSDGGDEPADDSDEDGTGDDGTKEPADLAVSIDCDTDVEPGEATECVSSTQPDSVSIDRHIWIAADASGTYIGFERSASATFTFSDEGDYEIELRVRDEHDRDATVSQWVSVEAEPEETTDEPDTGGGGVGGGGGGYSGGGAVEYRESEGTVLIEPNRVSPHHATIEYAGDEIHLAEYMDEHSSGHYQMDAAEVLQAEGHDVSHEELSDQLADAQAESTGTVDSLDPENHGNHGDDEQGDEETGNSHNNEKAGLYQWTETETVETTETYTYTETVGTRVEQTRTVTETYEVREERTREVEHPVYEDVCVEWESNPAGRFCIQEERQQVDTTTYTETYYETVEKTREVEKTYEVIEYEEVERTGTREVTEEVTRTHTGGTCPTTQDCIVV